MNAGIRINNILGYGGQLNLFFVSYSFLVRFIFVFCRPGDEEEVNE